MLQYLFQFLVNNNHQVSQGTFFISTRKKWQLIPSITRLIYGRKNVKQKTPKNVNEQKHRITLVKIQSHMQRVWRRPWIKVDHMRFVFPAHTVRTSNIFSMGLWNKTVTFGVGDRYVQAEESRLPEARFQSVNGPRPNLFPRSQVQPIQASRQEDLRWHCHGHDSILSPGWTVLRRPAKALREPSVHCCWKAAFQNGE